MSADSPVAGATEWPSLGVVVPVYDERATIDRAIREIAAAARRYPGRARIVAVDDGSRDGTGALLGALGGELDLLEVCGHDRNRGYGAALRTGALRARELGLEYLAFIDSDLTNPPEDLLKIGELARSGHLYVKASRFVRGGGMRSVPPARGAASRLGNRLGRALFGTRVRDVTNGFRGVRTDLFLSWPLREDGFAVILEEFDWALRSGIEPTEFPSVLTARTREQRATAFAYSPRVIAAYLKYPAGALARRVRGGGHE